MDSKKISTIVEILVADVTVVTRCQDLYYKLGVTMDIHCLLARKTAGSISSSDVFRAILEQWRSEQGRKGTVEILCQVLESMKFVDAAEKIQAIVSGNEAGHSAEPLFFGFERISENFTGRREQIDKIDKMLKGDFVKIIGMGGIGKTELAKKFANEHKEWNCIWLNAENPQILQTSVTLLGQSIGIRDGNIQFKELFRCCLKQIQTTNSFQVLVIVDNVDADYPEAFAVIDVIKDQQNCFAIVTSRNVGVMNCAGKATINLETLKNPEAIELVRSSLEGERDEDIFSLCEHLDNFPLALQQAVAYIKQRQQKGLQGDAFKIPQYLQLYEIEKKKLLNFPLNQLEHKYMKTTLITWMTSILAIEAEGTVGKVSIDLLNFIAYMNADDIPVDFIQDIYDKYKGSSDQVTEALELLKAYSLVRVGRNELISVHRLVQEVVRVHLTDSEVLKKLIDAIDKFILSGYMYFREAAKNALSVWSYFSKLQNDELERQFMSKRINLMNKYFLEEEELGINFYKRSVKLAIRLFGQFDKQTLIIESRTAIFDLSRKYDKKKLGKVQAVLAKQIEIGDVEESVFTAYNLSISLLEFWEMEEGVKVLQSIRDKEPQWNELLVEVVAQVAVRFKDIGMVGEWAEVGERVLESIIKQQGKEHPWATKIRDRILDYKYFWGEATDEEWDRALAVFIRFFGQDSEEVIDLKREISERNIRRNAK